MQPRHGVVEVGEARRPGRERSTGLGVVAGGVADLGADAEPAERGEQGTVRVDLGRVGGDADRGQGREFGQEGKVRRDRKGRLRAEGAQARIEPVGAELRSHMSFINPKSPPAGWTDGPATDRAQQPAAVGGTEEAV